jgi:hypothetical protein
MATSAMDPNRVAAAPHEPDGGSQRPGARARAAFGPLILGAEMAPMEKLRDGRGTDLWWLPLGGDVAANIKAVWPRFYDLAPSVASIL